MTMHFFEYLQDDYGAADPVDLREGREVDLARIAKRKINQKIIEDGPLFKATCPTMVKRAMFTNANMARVEAEVSPTLSAMATDLSRMKSKLRQLDRYLNEEAPAIAPLQELAALVESWPNWMNVASVGVVPLIRQFVKLMGGYKTATGTAADALAIIESKIDYLNDVRASLRSRVNRTSIESDCNAASHKPMVEHVCTDYGINYRRMMKSRVRGVHASWDDPCDTYYVQGESGRLSTEVKHPPGHASNWQPLPVHYARQGAVELRYANLCKVGECGKGPTKSLYGEGGVAASVNRIEGFLGTGPDGGTAWSRDVDEIEDDIRIYEVAVDQAMAQLAAIPAILRNGWVREFFIQLTLTASGVHGAALTTTFIPGIGPILAGIGEVTAQGIAHWSWGEMVKTISKHVKKVRGKKNAIITKANDYLAQATQSWRDADNTFDNLRGPTGALVYAQRGIVNFKKARPKRSLCNPIYPTRSPKQWATLAGYSSAAHFNAACPVGHISVAPRTRVGPVPIYRPGTPEDEGSPGGTGERISAPERGSDLGAYGAVAGTPTTILGMKPWQVLLLGAGAYWLWTECK